MNGSFFHEWRCLEVVHTRPDFDIVALTDPSDVPGVVMAKRSLLEPWRTRPRYLDLSLSEWKTFQAKYKRDELQ